MVQAQNRGEFGYPSSDPTEGKRKPDLHLVTNDDSAAIEKTQVKDETPMTEPELLEYEESLKAINATTLELEAAKKFKEIPKNENKTWNKNSRTYQEWKAITARVQALNTGLEDDIRKKLGIAPKAKKPETNVETHEPINVGVADEEPAGVVISEADLEEIPEELEFPPLPEEADVVENVESRVVAEPSAENRSGSEQVESQEAAKPSRYEVAINKIDAAVDAWKNQIGNIKGYQQQFLEENKRPFIGFRAKYDHTVNKFNQEISGIENYIILLENRKNEIQSYINDNKINVEFTSADLGVPPMSLTQSDSASEVVPSEESDSANTSDIAEPASSVSEELSTSIVENKPLDLSAIDLNRFKSLEDRQAQAERLKSEMGDLKVVRKNYLTSLENTSGFNLLKRSEIKNSIAEVEGQIKMHADALVSFGESVDVELGKLQIPKEKLAADKAYLKTELAKFRADLKNQKTDIVEVIARYDLLLFMIGGLLTVGLNVGQMTRGSDVADNVITGEPNITNMVSEVAGYRVESKPVTASAEAEGSSKTREVFALTEAEAAKVKNFTEWRRSILAPEYIGEIGKDGTIQTTKKGLNVKAGTGVEVAFDGVVGIVDKVEVGRPVWKVIGDHKNDIVEKGNKNWGNVSIVITSDSAESPKPHKKGRDIGHKNVKSEVKGSRAELAGLDQLIDGKKEEIRQVQAELDKIKGDRKVLVDITKLKGERANRALNQGLEENNDIKTLERLNTELAALVSQADKMAASLDKGTATVVRYKKNSPDGKRRGMIETIVGNKRLASRDDLGGRQSNGFLEDDIVSGINRFRRQK